MVNVKGFLATSQQKTWGLYVFLVARWSINKVIFMILFHRWEHLGMVLGWYESETQVFHGQLYCCEVPSSQQWDRCGKWMCLCGRVPWYSNRVPPVRWWNGETVKKGRTWECENSCLMFFAVFGVYQFVMSGNVIPEGSLHEEFYILHNEAR